MAVGFGHSLSTLNWFSLKLALVAVYIIFGVLTLKLQIIRLYRFVLFGTALILYSSILVLAVMKPYLL